MAELYSFISKIVKAPSKPRSLLTQTGCKIAVTITCTTAGSWLTGRIHVSICVQVLQERKHWGALISTPSGACMRYYRSDGSYAPKFKRNQFLTLYASLQLHQAHLLAIDYQY